MAILKNIKIEGKCPSCGLSNSVKFCDLYYVNNKLPYAVDIPICSNCLEDEIQVRKINNRRYKIEVL